MPPPHADISRPEWSAALSGAFDDLTHRLQHHHHAAIDSYAATDPVEFFAVITEVFFEDPQPLHEHYPHVYAQFKNFYRQDSLKRGR